MIRLRKVSLLNNISRSKSPLFYWSLSAGAITTVAALSIGYVISQYRRRQRTLEAIEVGNAQQLLDPSGLNREELEKAVRVLEENKLKEQIQLENFERYKRIRDKRRQEAGLA